MFFDKSSEKSFDLTTLNDIPDFQCLLSETRYFSIDELSRNIFCQKPIESIERDVSNGLLINIDKKEINNNFFSRICSLSSNNSSIWKLASNIQQSKKTKIDSGDFIRFGNQIVKMRLKSSDEHLTDFLMKVNEDVFEEITFKQPLKTRKLDRNLECRFCLENERTNDAFLSDLCSCSDTMPTHTSCFLKWIEHNTKPKFFRDLRFYDLTCIYCEICLAKFPRFVKIDKQKKPFLSLLIEGTTEFITFQVFENDSSKIKGIVLIALDGCDNFKIPVGRSEVNILRFHDKSIFEGHAHFLWRKKLIYLINGNQKFGTFVKKEENKILLRKSDNHVFTFGKTAFIIHLNYFLKKCQCEKFYVPRNPISSNDAPSKLSIILPKIKIPQYIRPDNGPYLLSERVQRPIRSNFDLDQNQMTKNQNSSFKKVESQNNLNNNKIEHFYPQIDISDYQVSTSRQIVQSNNITVLPHIISANARHFLKPGYETNKVFLSDFEKTWGK